MTQRSYRVFAVSSSGTRSPWANNAAAAACLTDGSRLANAARNAGLKENNR